MTHDKVLDSIKEYKKWELCNLMSDGSYDEDAIRALFKVLKSKGFSINEPINYTGESWLDWAKRWGKKDIVKIMLEEENE